MTLELKWGHCKGDVWCKLNTVNLDNEYFDDLDGVYIIWYMENSKPITVRVGQGQIRERLTDHRDNEDIQAYADKGLKVTWAKVKLNQRDGVERYLGEKLNPKVGERFPQAEPIQCNLPKW
ncbi:MAG: hypothetical protein AB7E47_06350 [Desulfovibrionaceae bacterium]